MISANDPKWNQLIDALRVRHGLGAEVKIEARAHDGKANLDGFCWAKGYGVYWLMVRPQADEATVAMVIGHELCHVGQLHRGDLALIDGGYIWKKDTYSFAEVPYRSRLHEIEARRHEQPALQKAYNLGLLD